MKNNGLQHAGLRHVNVFYKSLFALQGRLPSYIEYKDDEIKQHKLLFLISWSRTLIIFKYALKCQVNEIGNFFFSNAKNVAQNMETNNHSLFEKMGLKDLEYNYA